METKNTLETIYIDLSKLSGEQIKEIGKALRKHLQKIGFHTNIRLSEGKLYTNTFLYFSSSFQEWCLWPNKFDDRTELTYPEFIKLFEGGEEEKTDLSIGWIDAQEQRPLCISTGDWDCKQSDIVLAETFTGKKFLAQCYEGIMDGSAFYDWYQVDEINSNDWFINESVSRWMKIPF